MIEANWWAEYGHTHPSHAAYWRDWRRLQCYGCFHSRTYCDNCPRGKEMSQTEKAIVAMLRSQINTYKSKPTQAALLRAIRLIEAGSHLNGG